MNDIKNNTEIPISSSCKLLYEMLGQQPATYKFNVILPSTIINSDNNANNLLRAYIACEKGLEISPLKSTSRYSIFVSPAEAQKHTEEVGVLKKHGTFSAK